MTKGRSLFSTTAVKDENPILPGFVIGSGATTTPIPIPQDGWLRISLSASQYSSEQNPVKIRALLMPSKETVSIIMVMPGQSISSCDFVPVKAGQSIALGNLEGDESEINASKSWLGIAFYPMLSM